MNRIVVSGLGSVTAQGLDVDSVWQVLLAGQPRFVAMEPIYRGMKAGLLAARLDADARAQLCARAPACTGPGVPDSSLFAVDAALQAVRDAGLTPGDPALADALVCVGNNEAQADILDRLLEGDAAGFAANRYSSQAIADHVAVAIGSRGPALCFHNTCASSNVALELALRMLRAGVISTAVVGGGDAFSKKVWSGFYTLNALGDQPCRPFARERRYITIAEGAAFLVLRREEVAGDRPAYAELLAVASNNDASHPTNPDLNGVADCHRRVLAEAGLVASDIDAIYAHGTGTRANDLTEGTIFAQDYRGAAITGIKGTLGHMMATAGAIGAVGACLSLRHQHLPPTAIDATACEYDIDLVTGTGGRARRLVHVQNNSFGFGGNNAISVFKALET